MSMLSPEDLERLAHAESLFPSPIPTQPIPEALRAKYRLDPLGPADGPVKSAIFGGNNARLYDFKPSQQAALADDGIASARAAYALQGTERTNLAYGYVRR